MGHPHAAALVAQVDRRRGRACRRPGSWCGREPRTVCPAPLRRYDEIVSFDPTGRQVFLRASHDGRVVSAQISQVGASLRHLAVDGVDVVPSFPAGISAPGASGIVLVPWPNRVRGGTWTVGDTTYQLAITEPALDNASHGLLRFTAYDVADGPESVTLRADVFPQTGYPFHLQTSVTYALVADGIVVTHAIRNVGTSPAPVALGTHPYLTVGDAPASEITVTSSGTTYFVVDDKLVPTGSAAVTPENDLRAGQVLADLVLDTAYTGLSRDASGRASHTLRDTAGRTVTLWQDESFDYVQLYTARPYADRDVSIAVEPMTAPANAFNTGEGVRWLAPDEDWQAQWGITYAAS